MKFPEETLAAFVNFFKDKEPEAYKGSQNFSEKAVQKLEGLELDCSQSPYARDVDLKMKLKEMWHSRKTPDERFDIARWVVRDWGGIWGNHPKTIAKYVKIISEEKVPESLNGVPSYSKILMVSDPEKYVIYDSRVAVSLNTIQILANVKEGVAFNYLASRNKVLAANSGFLSRDEFKQKALKQCGWQATNEQNCYAVYHQLLREINPLFPDYKLYDLEMILFQYAPCLAKKTINRGHEKRQLTIL